MIELTPEMRADSEVLWQFLRVEDPLKSADATLVHGSSSKQTALRGARISRLFSQWLICSGNRGVMTKDWAKTEAEVFQEIAILNGIRPEWILLESESRNTRENFMNSFNLFVKRTKKKEATIITVPLPWACKRNAATADKAVQDLGLEFTIITACLTHTLDEFAEFNTPWERLIPSMRGELPRLDEYGKRGHLIPQDIPDQVWQASERLGKIYNNCR